MRWSWCACSRLTPTNRIAPFTEYEAFVRALRRAARLHDLLVTIPAARTTPAGELLVWASFRFAPHGLSPARVPGLIGFLVEVQLLVSRDVIRVVAWPDLG